MRTLGLLGGMAWPSTAEAYRVLNTEVAARLGGVHSAQVLLWSVDFAEVEALQHAGEWEQAGALLADAARRLELAGAEGLLLCTNTMHKVADAIEAATSVPLLHIADTTAAAVLREGVTRVGLLGTRFTMEEPFLRDRLAGHGLEVLVPPADVRDEVHRVIYEELVHGRTLPASRDRFRRVAADLLAAGAEGIVAGCTEIELLLGPEDIEGGWYPTSELQVLAAADWMLAGHEACDGSGGTEPGSGR
ncbi:MAG: aspartate/glutamate racemase family protein [Nitriliruptoraceae bacterium]